MKQITECLSCGGSFPLRVCYEVELKKETTDLSGRLSLGTIEGYVCAVCNKGLGYKTNQKKFEKALEIRKVQETRLAELSEEK